MIQRHHKRVLDELKLDVEEFIAPPPTLDDDIDLESISRSSQGHQGHQVLTRCESMDFKKQESPVLAADPNKNHSSVRLSSKLWQSARKCSEVIQRKW